MKHIAALLLLLLFTVLGCSSSDQHSAANSSNKLAAPDSEHISIVDELRQIADQDDNLNVWHLNRIRAEAIERELLTADQPEQRIGLAFKAGLEWLNAGEFQKSVDLLQEASTLAQELGLNIAVEQEELIREVLGSAYLRKAEVENCIANHNQYSCLIPIHKNGQHTNRESATRARDIFRSLLEDNPSNVQALWLYNIAHMTLGGYPDQIEPKYLVDEAAFQSEAEIPRFRDRATELGVDFADISGSVIIDDFNNDNVLDLMVSSYGLDDQLRFLVGDGSGRFVDRTKQAGLLGQLSGLNLIQADFNNDGWLDALVLRGAWLGAEGLHPNSLLANDGKGGFVDVTHEAGLYCKYPTQTACWLDFNNDGWIDLFIANESTQSVGAPCQLFANNGDGTFQDVANAKGVAVKAFIKACICGDYDNDGNVDLYVSTMNGRNHLFRNGGIENDFAFEDVALQTGTEEPTSSFPCWFFDYDQDGWQDLFVSGFDMNDFASAAGEVAKDYLNKPVFAELPRLYRNNGDGTFEETSESAGVNKVLYTMGCNFGDLNNDGFPDFYAGTGTPDFRSVIPNRMFLNDHGKRFLDVTQAGGFGHVQKGHGLAFADLDHDGDQDIYQVLGGSYDGDYFMNALFENPGTPGAKWVKLKLVGTSSNRAAIGSRVEIVAANDEGEVRSFHSVVNSGGSFGANPLRIEQGLDDFGTIKQVNIVWSGTSATSTIAGISANGFYEIVQGNDEATEIPITPFVLGE